MRQKHTLFLYASGEYKLSQRILLIDCGSVFHAVKFSLGGQKLSHKDKPTFVIYGFLLKLQYMIGKIKPDVVVYAVDSKESKRKEIYHTYKEKRHTEKTKEQKELDELAFPQFAEIENYVIPTLGYRNIFSERGFEADDIIGRICKSYSDCEIIVVSTDKDFYQLLTDSTCIFDPRKNKYYSKHDFVKQYKIEPKIWKRVKAIGGCTSDEVKGVPIPQNDLTKKQRHVAETGALNFLKGKTSATTQAYKAITSVEGRKIINRNKSLVILPFRGTPDFKILPDRPKLKGLKEICEKYNFRSILSDVDSYKRILKLY